MQLHLLLPNDGGVYMKYPFLLLFAIAFGTYITSGCSNSTTTTNTLYVHDTIAVPDWDDSLWIPRVSGKSTAFIAGIGGVVERTTDAGLTWTALTPMPLGASGDNTVYGIWFFDKMNGIAIGGANGVQHTSDGGQSWNGTTMNTSFTLRSIYFTNATTGYIGTSDPTSGGSAGEIWKTTDAGVTWTKVSLNQYGGICCIRFGPDLNGILNGMNGIAVGMNGKAFWTSDGGNTWHLGGSGTTGHLLSCVWMNNLQAFATAYSASSGLYGSGTIQETDDAGLTWRTIYTTYFGGPECIATNGNGVFTVVCYNGGIVESTKSSGWTESQFGQTQWETIAYASATRSIIAGEGGEVATRHRQF
jgi:photosystem II stability/assembly factor-like uncharacterized protein